MGSVDFNFGPCCLWACGNKYAMLFMGLLSQVDKSNIFHMSILKNKIISYIFILSFNKGGIQYWSFFLYNDG